MFSLTLREILMKDTEYLELLQGLVHECLDDLKKKDEELKRKDKIIALQQCNIELCRLNAAGAVAINSARMQKHLISSIN
jgi:hypothetical protein